METKNKIMKVVSEIKDLLLIKNERCGDSALSPLRIFSKHIGECANININLTLTMLDDKLSRIENSETLCKSDVADILGYLILLCVANDWLDFKDLVD